MIGIIYKFTILVRYKIDNHRPFYVGQHFGLEDFYNYWGSGSIWDDFIKRLKKDYPTCWKKLIKREILYQRPCSQKVLDKMEEYYIKKEKAHYSFHLGGTNVLLGTANKFGSGSPMKDAIVAAKCSESMKRFNKMFPEKKKEIEKKRIWALHNTNYKQKISNTLKGRYIGDKNPNFGNYWTEKQRKKMSDRLLKKDLNGSKNPMYGKVRITNGIVNKVINKNESLPEGWWYGMKSRRK